MLAFTLARTTTFIACCPNSKELTVSNWSVIVGATHTMRQVFAPPPIAFESSRVSFDSRNGGRSFLLDANISMQRPSVVSDWLIAFASSNALPSTPDFLTRSDPARSTRYSLPISVRGPPTTLIPSMSTACERDESAFILVEAVARLELPNANASIAAPVVVTASQWTPETYTPSFGSSRSSTDASGRSRSEISSR